MNVNYKDFIATYTDVYPEGYCEHLISEFERLVQSGAGSNRQRSDNVPRHRKDDMQLGLDIKVHQTIRYNEKDVVDVFFDGLQQCFEEYTSTFSVLKDGKINGSAMKLQRTSPGEGYHIWHGEQGNNVNASRVIVYMLYLNTLAPEEGGKQNFCTNRNAYTHKKIQWCYGQQHLHTPIAVMLCMAKTVSIL